MFNLSGLLAIAVAGGRLNGGMLKRIGSCAGNGPVHRSLSAYVGSAGAGSADNGRHLAPRHARDAASHRRRRSLDRRPRSYKDRPQLLSNADIGYSPWIGAAQLEADGMLVLWQHAISASTNRRIETFKSPRMRLSSATSSCHPNRPRADCALAFSTAAAITRASACEHQWRPLGGRTKPGCARAKCSRWGLRQGDRGL